MAIQSAEEFVELRFSEDPSEYERAAKEPADTAVWLAVIERYPDARVWVAYNKAVPLEILTLLADDPNSEVRAMVAMKRKLTPDLLRKLSTDRSVSVKMAVVMNKKTPNDLLRRLMEDPSGVVSAAARVRLGEVHN